MFYANCRVQNTAARWYTDFGIQIVFMTFQDTEGYNFDFSVCPWVGKLWLSLGVSILHQGDIENWQLSIR